MPNGRMLILEYSIWSILQQGSLYKRNGVGSKKAFENHAVVTFHSFAFSEK